MRGCANLLEDYLRRVVECNELRIKLIFDHLKVGRSIDVPIEEDGDDYPRRAESCTHHHTRTVKRFFECPIRILFSPLEKNSFDSRFLRGENLLRQ